MLPDKHQRTLDAGTARGSTATLQPQLINHCCPGPLCQPWDAPAVLVCVTPFGVSRSLLFPPPLASQKPKGAVPSTGDPQTVHAQGRCQHRDGSKPSPPGKCPQLLTACRKQQQHLPSPLLSSLLSSLPPHSILWALGTRHLQGSVPSVLSFWDAEAQLIPAAVPHAGVPSPATWSTQGPAPSTACASFPVPLVPW